MGHYLMIMALDHAGVVKQVWEGVNFDDKGYAVNFHAIVDDFYIFFYK